MKKCTMFMDWTTKNYENDAVLPKFYRKAKNLLQIN